MKPVDDKESTERQPQAALLTLLKTVDPESLLPYTAVREIEAMAGERVLEAVKALRAETHGEFKALRAETRGEFKALRAETKAMHAEALSEFKGALADTRSEFKRALADTRSEFKGALAETRSEFKGALAETRSEFNEALADTRAEIKALRVETQVEFSAIKGAIASNAAAIGANAREMRNLLASQGEMKGELKAIGGTYKQMLWVLIGFVATTLTSAVVALYVQLFGN